MIILIILISIILISILISIWIEYEPKLKIKKIDGEKYVVFEYWVINESYQLWHREYIKILKI